MVEARLLGLSGMLLTELAPSQNGAYVRRIWDFGGVNGYLF